MRLQHEPLQPGHACKLLVSPRDTDLAPELQFDLPTGCERCTACGTAQHDLDGAASCAGHSQSMAPIP